MSHLRRQRQRLLFLTTSGLLLLATAWVLRQVAVAPASLMGLVIPPRELKRPLTHADRTLATACRAVRVSYPPPNPRIDINKADRLLAFYSGSVLLKEYPVGLGGDSDGDKEREGDRRTPTGDFYVCTRLRRSRWHRFLGISYPAPDDAKRGREHDLISPGEFGEILRAHRDRNQPPWKTALGSEIGIHGGGSGLDWTWGCIALENEAVAELFPVLPLGTPVRIQ